MAHSDVEDQASTPASLLHVDQNTAGQSRHRFSRSPHPYHRQSLDLPDPIYRFQGRTSDKALGSISTAPGAFVEDVVTSPTDYFNSSTRGSNTFGAASSDHKLTTSPSESGTEADDERPLLKALTAPPLRPRKGLRSADNLDGDLYLSPLPTPSLVEQAHVSSPRVGASQRGSARSGDQVSEKPTTKPSLKQRAGLARRLLEVVLLVINVALSFKGVDKDLQHTLLFQLALAASLYLLYTLVLLASTRKMDFLRLGHKQSLLSSDPAIVLYPLLVPVLVAVSLPKREGLVETNLMLGLCSMPLQAMPLRSVHWQWLLTILPHAFREQYLGLYQDAVASTDTDDAFIYLLPLHLCLKSCLEYLTATSLLPTEIELLSVGLINLLIFADSPQTYILKALLWLGGLMLFCSCKDVLGWTVSLARVPDWKFRKISRASSSASPFWIALDEALGGWLSSKGRNKPSNDSEDSDEECFTPSRRQTATPSRRARSGTSHEKSPTLHLPHQNGHVQQLNRSLSIDDHKERTPRSRQRRYTLPTAPSGLQDLPELSRKATQSIAKFRQQPKYYPSLTSTQACILKWIYASFVYFMVLFTILVPIRIYVSYRALGGQEPIGWALGYLLGEIPPFRYWVQRLKLDWWICLPAYEEPDNFIFRQLEIILGFPFGPANTRLLICAYCIFCILLGLVLVFRLSAVAEVDTRRKVFHGMMVLMFGVTAFIDPSFISLALALVLAVFLLLDLFRAGQLPPVSRPLTIFLAPYVDGRDHKGPVVISPIFLLIGCAIPLWLSLAALDRTGNGAFEGWEIPMRDISMTTGIVCVGMGDAAASLIGRRFGRRRWPWGGGKSLEGSLAFAVAVVVGLMASRAYLALGPWEWDGHEGWVAAFGKACVAASAASLTETVLTGANDNVLVPITLWLWVKAVGLQ